MAPIDDPIQYPSSKRLYLEAVDWSDESLKHNIITLLTQTGIQRALDAENNIWVVVMDTGWQTDSEVMSGFVETHICAVGLNGDRTAWVFAGLWSSSRELHVRARSGEPHRTETRVRAALRSDRDLRETLTQNLDVWVWDRPRGIRYSAQRPRNLLRRSI